MIDALGSCQIIVQYHLRALESVKDLTDLLKGTTDPGAPDHDNEIIKIHSKILDQLISFYESIGDCQKAQRLMDQLLALPGETLSDPELCHRLANSLSRTSPPSQEVLQTLTQPERMTPSLSWVEGGLFPLFQRAMLGQVSSVIPQLLAISQKDFAKADIIGRNVLHIAAEISHCDFEELLAHSDDEILDGRDMLGRTPLFLAVCLGNFAFMKQLVQKGADLYAKYDDGWTLLTAASRFGSPPIVKYLLVQNLSPNDDVLLCMSPLHAAAIGSHYEVCSILLEHGAWADRKTLEGETAANWSTDARMTEMLKRAEQDPRYQEPEKGRLSPTSE